MVPTSSRLERKYPDRFRILSEGTLCNHEQHAAETCQGRVSTSFLLL